MDHRTEGVLEILVVGLLRDSNNNNNHNIIRMNRDDETLVKSGKFKDCVLSWKVKKRLQAQCTYFLVFVFLPGFFLRPRSCL